MQSNTNAHKPFNLFWAFEEKRKTHLHTTTAMVNTLATVHCSVSAIRHSLHRAVKRLWRPPLPNGTGNDSTHRHTNTNDSTNEKLKSYSVPKFNAIELFIYVRVFFGFNFFTAAVVVVDDAVVGAAVASAAVWLSILLSYFVCMLCLCMLLQRFAIRLLGKNEY